MRFFLLALATSVAACGQLAGTPSTSAPAPAPTPTPPAPTPPAAPETELVATTSLSYGELEADDQYAYVAGNGVLSKIPLAGGPIVTLEPSGVYDFVPTVNGLAYVVKNGTGNDAIIRERYRDGTAHDLDHFTAFNTVTIAAHDGAIAYAYAISDTMFAPDNVKLTIHEPSGAVTAQNLDEQYAVQVLLDATNAYMTTSQSIYVVPRSGASITTIDTTGAAGTPCRRQFAMDDTAFYFRSNNGPAPDDDYTLKRLPKVGGAPVLLGAPEPDHAPWNGVAVSDGMVYFAQNSYALRRIPAAGGTYETIDPEPMEDGKGNDPAVAVNSTHVLWLNSAGEIWRRRK
jgi:hypothetical protein